MYLFTNKDEVQMPYKAYKGHSIGQQAKKKKIKMMFYLSI